MLRFLSSGPVPPDGRRFQAQLLVLFSAMIPDPDKTASIHLDYGADSADFDVQDLHVCRQGLRIKTRWYFEPGTELSVNFQVADDGGTGAGRLLKTEGIVVDCAREDDDTDYLVSVLFLEVTDDILAVIRDVSESVEFS